MLVMDTNRFRFSLDSDRNVNFPTLIYHAAAPTISTSLAKEPTHNWNKPQENQYRFVQENTFTLYKTVLSLANYHSYYP